MSHFNWRRFKIAISIQKSSDFGRYKIGPLQKLITDGPCKMEAVSRRFVLPLAVATAHSRISGLELKFISKKLQVLIDHGQGQGKGQG